MANNLTSPGTETGQIDSTTPGMGEQRYAEESRRALENLFSAAQASAVYSTPVSAGNYTVITACEVFAAGGAGSGSGSGPATQAASATVQEQGRPDIPIASGGGSGGGGVAIGRPIAVISIGPDGVDVKPVLDVTKIALAGITLWGTVAAIIGKVWKASR